MFRFVLQGVALLSACALLASAQCAATCTAEAPGHGAPAEECPSHHNQASHQHNGSPTAPAPDDHSHGPMCREHGHHAVAIEKAHLDFTPAMAVFAVLAADPVGLTPLRTFPAPSRNAHSPPGTTEPGSFSTVLRI